MVKVLSAVLTDGFAAVEAACAEARADGRLAGYEDVNDADRLCRDPAMRWVVVGKAPMDRAASASQMGRFETEWLAGPENLAALADLPGQWRSWADFHIICSSYFRNPPLPCPLYSLPEKIDSRH
jgi:hypothetical protein